jgi:hypothetical protein
LTKAPNPPEADPPAGLTSGGLKGRSVLTCLMRGAVRYG